MARWRAGSGPEGTRVRFWARAATGSLVACLGVACANGPSEDEVPCEMARGEALFSQCAVCHAIDPSLGHGAGPNLFGVFGRPIGEAAGFKFSPALRREEGAWTEDRLDEYLADPFGSIPGSRMAFAGLPKPEDREALICYLASTSESP